MKKITALLALVLTVSASQAQETQKQQTGKQHQRHGKAFKKHHGDFGAKLNLTESQKTSMKANREDFRKKLEALKSQPGITLKDYNEGKARLEKERKLKMDALLTAEQKQQMADMRKAKMEKRKEMENKRMDRMSKELSLSSDQVAKLKTQKEATHQKMKALHENDKLSREQKQDQAKLIREEAKKQREAILTAEQLQKMKDRKAEHGRRNQEAKKK